MKFPTKENPEPPVPNSHLSVQVLGSAASNSDFLFGGFVISEGIKRALEFIGKPIDSFRQVLDFGCGSARVLRWFKQYDTTRWNGADISSEAIGWNQQNLGFGEFITNGMAPPLPFLDESFDLVYAVSVLTHLAEDLQFEWLAEIRRILKPGGTAMLTVSGEEIARWRLSAGEFATYRSRGYFYKHVQQGLHGLPDFYQDAYHSRKFVLEQWSRYITPVAYIRNGLMYMQDLVIARKAVTATKAPPDEILDVSLPFGGFWSPLVADVIRRETMTLEGWAFQFDTESVRLSAFVDGSLLGRGVANLPSPGVASTLPFWAGAQNAGFQIQIPTRGLGTGPHVLSLLADSEPLLPFMTTYFFFDSVC